MNTVESQGSFMQWVADNVDHNIQTLTGKGTFHGKDIISISASSKTKFCTIKILKLDPKVNLSNASVKVTPYYGSSEIKIKFNSVKDLPAKTVSTPEMNLDFIWQATWFFTKKSSPHLN